MPQESLLINSPKDDTYDLELLSNSDESLLVLALSEGNCGCSAHPECHEHFMSVLVMLVVMVQWCEQNSVPTEGPAHLTVHCCGSAVPLHRRMPRADLEGSAQWG